MSTKPGPEWRSVIRRKTISMNNGTIIEDINITPELTKAFLTRKLPMTIHKELELCSIVT